MHGNVGEWVEDVWHENYQGAPSGGSAWKDAGARQDLRLGVLRGGSWQYIPDALPFRLPLRQRFNSGSRNNDNGFRVATERYLNRPRLFGFFTSWVQAKPWSFWLSPYDR